MDYQKYLQSDEWRNKCIAVRDFWDNRCAVCNSDINTHVHHRTYHNIGHEQANDMILLCELCHTTFHKIVNPLSMFDQIAVMLKGIPR
jgi:hypothetical protein